MAVEKPTTRCAVGIEFSTTASAILEACRVVADDPYVRVVVVRGEGRCFGTGGDLAVLQSGASEAAADLIDRMDICSLSPIEYRASLGLAA